MEQNREPNNPWEARRVNMTRPSNLMQDIKRPTAPSPTYIPQNPQQPPVTEYNPQIPSRKKFYVWLLITVIVLCGLGFGGFYFYKQSESPQVDTSSQLTELDKAVLEISKIALLPINDTPALISVTDPEQLRNDAFFDRSLSGDQMLLYPRIGFAVLYRPSTNQIINMMSFDPNIANSTTTATSTATTTKSR